MTPSSSKYIRMTHLGQYLIDDNNNDNNFCHDNKNIRYNTYFRFETILEIKASP